MMKCPLWGGQMYDITHADDVVRETDKSPTLNARMGTGGNQVPILMGDIPSEKNGIITYDVKTTVKVRRHEVDTDAIRTLLRDALNRSGLSKKDIAERLDVPQTQVDHYFRQDKYFSLPDADVWIPLKNLLGITTDEFDKQVMEFDEIECNFDTANRIYDAQGISPTITSVNADRMVLQSEKDIKTEVIIMGHDERSAKFNTEVTDPLTACDYKQPQIIAQMSTTGGQNAYAIGNGQANQPMMTDKVGALNCMHDPIAIMQQVVTGEARLEVCVPMTDEDLTGKM